MSSGDPPSGRSRLQTRLQARLQGLLEEGNYYEALQVYLTLYARQLSSSGHEEAGEVLYEGAEVLLSRSQLEGAQELAVKWVEHLRTHSVSVRDGNLERALELFHQFKAAQKECTAAVKLMKVCIKWSQESGPERSGEPTLHFELGDLLWLLQRYQEARRHYIHGGQPEKFALRVLDLSVREGYQGEVGMFVSQVVLGLLGEGYLREAERALKTFTSNHPQLQAGFPFKEHPLVNYNHMILEVLLDERGDLPSHHERCQYITDQYLSVIQIDPSLMEMLNKLNFLRSMQPFRGMLHPMSSLLPQPKLEEVDGLD